MTIAAKLRSWVRAMLHRRQMEREMDQELRFHIESFAEDLVRQGVEREEAMRRARIEFGGVEMHKEECRSSLGLRLWDELTGDLRLAVRMMRQSPGFTAVAVLSLALGIGVNTAIFNITKEVMLKTLAVPDSERLRLLAWTISPKAHWGISAWGSFDRNAAGEMVGTPFTSAVYREMRKRQEAFETLVAFKDVFRLTVTTGGTAESVDGELVSGNFYPGLGARVFAGRPIVESDDRPGAPPVAVISDAYWASRFGRSADALGQTIRVNEVPVTIVGVNAPEFHGAKAHGTPSLFLAIATQEQVIPNPRGPLASQNGFWWLTLIGRLKPGVSDQQALASLSVVFRNAVLGTIPGKREEGMPKLVMETGSRGLDLMKSEFSKPAYVLTIAAGLVLLIACANLANLLLARASAREREMSVRLAMGAGRWRLMRQVFTESLLLASIGGAAGLALGIAGENVIPNLFEASWRTSSLQGHFDWMVFGFALAITVATGLLFGAAPAWRSTRADVNAGLKETGRATASPGRALLGKSLVAFQVALSVLLLAGAGLFLRTLGNLQSTNLGFNPERILLFQLDPPHSRYAGQARVALYQQIEEKLGMLGGVESATVSEEPLVAHSMDNGCFRPTGRPPRSQREDSPWTNYVGSRFFETMGMRMVNGRAFTQHDSQGAPKVSVINQTLASQFFPNASPVGRTVTSCDGDGPPQTFEVVGVVADAKYSDLREAVPPTIFFPYAQSDDAGEMTFEVKTAASTESVARELREAVRSVDRDLPLLEVRTQKQQIDATLSRERVFATLTTGFGALALVLAGIGIYGIMSYTVARRTNEIGIRMALGAQTRGVLGMVLRETSLLTAIGVGAGIAGALAVTRLVATMLYGVKPNDLATFVEAAGLLVVMALIAALTPARRAARVDPMQALRHE